MSKRKVKQKYVNYDLLYLLKKAIKKFMEDNGLNWSNIKYANIKDKETFNIPVSWNTLHKAYKGVNIKVGTVEELLIRFDIDHIRKYGVIELPEPIEILEDEEI